MYSLMHCEICQDKKKFRIKINDAQRILYRLKELSNLLPHDFKLSKEDEFNCLILQTTIKKHWVSFTQCF